MEHLNPAELYANAGYVWLVVGVIFIAAEALGMPGIGFMFAGLGALVVGAAVQSGAIGTDAHVSQFILFFLATSLWVALLWKPLKRLHLARRSNGYSNIVGETAYVGSNGLSKDGGGEVTWSGTIMKARLAARTHVDKVDAGAQVTIVEVSGSTLIVKPKE